jgi:hypothetical protein
MNIITASVHRKFRCGQQKLITINIYPHDVDKTNIMNNIQLLIQKRSVHILYKKKIHKPHNRFSKCFLLKL